MKSSVTIAVFLLMLVATIAGGAIVRRSGLGAANPEHLKRAAQALGRPLPDRLGNWQVAQDTPLDARVVEMLKCPAHINRVYMHDQTGDRIAVAVMVGPAGPIAVHTPEICYSSQDYTIDSERTAVSFEQAEEAKHSFWDVVFRSSDVGGSKLRVLYAWSDGSRWDASERPRYAYAALPYLYKLQVAGPEAPAAGDFDPCRDFLSQFLGQLEKQLLAAPPAPSWPL
jgi:hypothetical protein